MTIGQPVWIIQTKAPGRTTKCGQVNNSSDFFFAHVTAAYFGFSNATTIGRLFDTFDSNQSYYEGVPTRWTMDFENAHGAQSWFGRLGAGDILARYRHNASAYPVVTRISNAINKLSNIYEAYNMDGTFQSGTSGWGDYLGRPF